MNWFPIDYLVTVVIVGFMCAALKNMQRNKCFAIYLCLCQDKLRLCLLYNSLIDHSMVGPHLQESETLNTFAPFQRISYKVEF